MKHLFSFLILVLIGTTSNLSADYISFDTTVTIQSQDRFIGFYVPKVVPLIDTFDVVIVLHHNSETAIECRERVIGELHWDTLFPSALFAFPDAGDTKDFYAPMENKGVIDSTLQILNRKYPVKKNRKIMISSGVNCRAAMKYSYDMNTYFNWLILIDPKMNGLNDVLNIAPASIEYNYNNSSYVSTVILKDKSRNIYLDSLERRLMVSENKLWSIESDKLSNKYPSDTLILEAISYLSAPTVGDNNFALKEIQMPLRICNLYIHPKLWVKHLRGNAYVSVDFHINNLTTNYNSKTNTSSGNPFTLTHGSMNRFAHSNFGGPIESGKTTFRISIDKRYSLLNYLDSIEKSIYYQPEVYNYPINMGFEELDTTFDKYWFIEPSGDIKTWNIDTLNSSDGENSLTMHNSKYQYDNSSQAENFYTPFVDLTKLMNKNIAFDYAFNYHIYSDVVNSDTLKVYITTDCDNTYELIYEASGEELATTSSPIINPTNKDEAIFIPKSNNWKKKVIDLSKYKDEEKVSIKFSIVSGMGGSTYLDNIRIGDAVSSIEESPTTSFEVFPNPVGDVLRISHPNLNSTFIIRDILGKEVLKIGKGESVKNIDYLQNGVYFISDDLGQTLKFIKK